MMQTPALTKPQDIQMTKAINGPSMRLGSPYPAGMLGFEHRQFHKRWEELWPVALQSDELETGGNLGRFQSFDEHPQISRNLISERLNDYRPENSALHDEIELFLISTADRIKERLQRMGAAIYQ